MKSVYRRESVVYRFERETPEPQALPLGYVTVKLDHSLVSELFNLPEDQWRAQQYPRLLDRGHVGFAILDRDQWAAVQWLAIPESGGPPHLPKEHTRGQYWCFNEHTRQSHRRLGLWRALKASGIGFARELSHDPSVLVYSDTGQANLVSRRAHENYGFQPTGTMSVVSLRIPGIVTLNWGRWEQTATHPDPAQQTAQNPE